MLIIHMNSNKSRLEWISARRHDRLVLLSDSEFDPHFVVRILCIYFCDLYIKIEITYSERYVSFSCVSHLARIWWFLNLKRLASKVTPISLPYKHFVINVNVWLLWFLIIQTLCNYIPTIIMTTIPQKGLLSAIMLFSIIGAGTESGRYKCHPYSIYIINITHITIETFVTNTNTHK